MSTSSSSSDSLGPERTLRLVLKLAQLLASLYLVICMYNIGPHWILLVASLAVPLYGLFLLFRSPELLLRRHPLPYVRYKALARARSWLRVDLAICATMAVVCLSFALVLLFGYFQEHSVNSALLQAAVASILLALLYSMNALMSARQLQMGRVDFLTEKQNVASLSTTRASTQSPLGDLNITTVEQPPGSFPLTMSAQSPPYPPGTSSSFGDGMRWRSGEEHYKPSMEINQQQLLSSPGAAAPTLLEQLQTELAVEESARRHHYQPVLATGREWRHIPIGGGKEEQLLAEDKRLEQRVRMEQRRTMPDGMDMGSFGSREEKWVRRNSTIIESAEDEKKVSSSRGGIEEVNTREREEGQAHLLPRLAVQMKEDGERRIQGEWSNGKSSSRDGKGPVELEELRMRSVEKKKERYQQTEESKTTVVNVQSNDSGRRHNNDANGHTAAESNLGKLRWKKANSSRRDFDVKIRPSTANPKKHSTELKIKDDRRETSQHQVTQL